MNAKYFQTLYDYSYWARDKLLAAMQGMSEADYARANGFTYGSIRAILTHALGAETRWFASLSGEARPSPTEADVPTVEALAARWRDLEVSVRAYLGGLTDEQALTVKPMRRRDGSELRLPLWQVLAHLANHGMQHRSEAAEALTMIGRSPGEVDLLYYFLEAGKSRA